MKLIAIALSCVCGCGSEGPDVVDVQGRITKGGQPVSHVVLQISPPTGRPSTARTDADGRFRPEFSQQIPHGVMQGKCRISIQVVRESIDKPVDLNDPKYHPETKAIIQHFGDWRTSPLQIEVTHKQPEIAIELDEHMPSGEDE